MCMVLGIMLSKICQHAEDTCFITSVITVDSENTDSIKAESWRYWKADRLENLLKEHKIMRKSSK